MSTDISKDKVVNRLAVAYGDFAALLYTWMLPHAADDCTVESDPEELLYAVMPGRRDKTPDNVKQAISGMEELGLLVRVDGELAFPPDAFYKYQTYINRANRRETPKNAASLSLSLSHSRTLGREEEILAGLHRYSGWNADASASKQIPLLIADFPNVDIEDEAKKWATWAEDAKKPPKNCFSSFRNWLKNCKPTPQESSGPWAEYE